MTDNIYAPPKAELAPAIEASTGAPFYIVSTRKFLILYAATLGMYQLFWHFKNWNVYRHAVKDSLWPVPRAIFAIFFTHALLGHVAAHRPERAVQAWGASGNAWQLVGLMFLSTALERLSQSAIGAPYVAWCSILVLIPLAFSYLPAQDQINARCGDPAGKSNDELSGANIAWCVIGAVLWILALIGLFG